MKTNFKRLVFLFTFIAAFTVLAAFSAGALSEGDFIYEVNNSKASVTGYTGEGGAVTVPEALGGYPVTEIADSAFSAFSNNVATAFDIKNITSPAGEITYFEFTPAATGIYTFTSFSESDTVGYLFDENKQEIISDDDSGDGYNFSVTYTLQAGTTYFWGAKLYAASMESTFDVLLFCDDCTCTHTDTVNTDEIPATCVSTGFTEGVFCNGCKMWLTGHIITEIIPHPDSDRDRICDSCGKPSTVAVSSGSCGAEGDNVKWTLYDNGELVIYGEGAMPDYYVEPTGPNPETDYYCSSPFNSIADINAVYVEEGVTYIGSFAFYRCNTISQINLPESIQGIGRIAFFGCTKLKKVFAPELDIWMNISFEDSTANPLYNKAELYNNGVLLTALTIPEGTEATPAYAFSGCASLTDITLPHGLKKISAGTFEGCSQITEITIPDTATDIGDYAFGNCSGITEITFGKSLTHIGIGSFSYCTALRSIAVPENVISIGTEAFYKCSNLSDISLHENLIHVGQNAFLLTPAYSEQSNTGNSLIYIDNVLVRAKINISGTVKIKEGTTLIADYAFDDTHNNFSLIVSNSVKHIGNYAFYDSNVSNIILGDVLMTIGDYAFKNCYNIKGLILPNSLTDLGEGAFYGCRFESMIIPQGITEIKDKLFCSCTNLKSLTIPNSVTNIGNSAFTGCRYLTDIILPYGITNIGEWAFDNCDSLTDVILPESVVTLGERAFSSCDKLESVVIPVSVTDIGSSLFYLSNSPVIYYAGTQNAWNNVNKGENLCYGSIIYNYDSCSSSHTELTIPGKAATCTESGLTEGKCCLICNAVLITQEVIPAFGHNEVSHDAKAPTCTEIGWNAYVTCSRCDYTTYSEIPATGHDYDSVVTAPTCTEKGVKTFTCKNDASHTYTEEIAALGHSEVSHDAKAPTCTTIGWNAYVTCSECDYTTYSEIPATGHDYVSVVTAPTCTEKGVKTFTCKNDTSHTYTEEIAALGHSKVSHDAKAPTCTAIGWNAYVSCSRCDYTTYSEIPATGHDYDSVVTAPTCTEKGVKTFTCKNDASHTYTEEIAALGHSKVSHDAKAPTCTEIGWNAYVTCSRCDYTTYSEIPATGHDYDSVITAPTCTEKGVKTFTCKNDASHTYTEEIAAFGHNEVSHDAKAPTCTEIGWNAYVTCSRCDYTTYSEIPATGHDYVSVVTAPTCTQNGYTTHNCKKCGNSYSDTFVNAKGHTPVYSDYVAPTCTQNGHTLGISCEVCGDIIKAQEIIPAKGHSYSPWITATQPTCEAEGKNIRLCACGSTEEEEIPALGHKEVTVEGKKATCTQSGLTEGKKCSVCNKVLLAQEDIPKNEHNEVTIKAIAATCVKSGKTAGKKCSVCGTVTLKQKTVKAKGHTLVTLKAVSATCTKSGKTAGKKCSVCKKVTVAQKTIAKTGHSYKTTTTKATLTKSGKQVTKCTACGKVSKTVTVYSPKKLTLSTYTYTYNGKERTPVVTVKDSKGNTLKKGTDYTVKYASGRKLPGKYSVTIIFKGKYSGKKTLSFKINPAAPKVTKIASTKKGVASLTWSNVTGETGYEVYFSTKKSSAFKKLGTYKVNAVNATKSKLTSGKTYYFKVRAYKTVDGSKIYSAYSPVKAVKIK